MKSLVIYYSLEGNTKLIADTIKNELNSDVLELRTKKQYPNKGFKKYLCGGKSVKMCIRDSLITYNNKVLFFLVFVCERLYSFGAKEELEKSLRCV